MDPNDKSDFAKLIAARGHSFDELEFNRKQRDNAVKEYVGASYAKGGAEHAVPMPLLTLAVQIWARYVAGKDPRVMLTTHYPQLRTNAVHFQYSLNGRFVAMDLQQTMRDGIVAAFFGAAFFKVFLEKVPGQRAMQPTVAGIDQDDWVHDTRAETWRDTQFRGHHFQIPLEEAQNNEKWDQDARDALQKARFDEQTRAGDTSKSSRDVERPIEMVDLWETYLPSEQMMMIDAGPGAEKPLRAWKFKGPDTGPYYMLGFGDVPRNIMPLASVAMLGELHRIANNLYRKMEDQADAQRNIILAAVSGLEDANKVLHSKDGDVIPVTSAELIKAISLGGVDARTMGFATHAVDRFFMMAGNLDLMGGLSPSATTLGQEKILSERANMLIQDIQARVLRAIQWCARSIGHYVWKDPVSADVFERPVPGVPGLTVPVRFGPEHRQGKLLSYEIKVEPYAMSYRSPTERGQAMFAVLDRLAPYYPDFLRQGRTFSADALIAKAAQLYDLPELEEILTYAEIPEGGGRGEEARAPANTHRVNERVNTAAPSRASREVSLVEAMTRGGGGGQSSE